MGFSCNQEKHGTMKESQLAELRQSLVDGLFEVIENHKVDIGGCLSSSDVIGALEWVKLQTYVESMGDDLLNSTTIDF